MCSISRQSANLYPFYLLFFNNFTFNTYPSICTKVYNADMNDESCELKQKKKSAGIKMDALWGWYQLWSCNSQSRKKYILVLTHDIFKSFLNMSSFSWFYKLVFVFLLFFFHSSIFFLV